VTPASPGTIGISDFGVCRGLSPIPFEIANSDFPIQSGPLIDRRDTWHRTSGLRGFGPRGFPVQGLNDKGTRDSPNPDSGR
jgi:hypothetical protein